MSRPSLLRDRLTNGYGLIAHCLDCGRFSASLNVSGVSVRFGEEFAVPKLKGKLTCSVCGGKRCEVQVDSNLKRWPSSQS